ncbi:IS3 family transposase [Streptomyces sp. NPDC054794]
MADERARSERKAPDDALAHEITVLHLGSRGAYGVPRIHGELRRLGHPIDHERIEHVMRERGITDMARRRRPSLACPARRAEPAPDLLGREFIAPAPGV